MRNAENRWLKLSTLNSSDGTNLYKFNQFWQVSRLPTSLFDATFTCRAIHVMKALLHELQVMVLLPQNGCKA